MYSAERTDSRPPQIRRVPPYFPLSQFGGAAPAKQAILPRSSAESVPSFVYVQDVNIGADPSASECIPAKTSVGKLWGVSGDVALDYALEEMNKSAKSPALEKMVTMIHGRD